jgi:hypothetical protein
MVAAVLRAMPAPLQVTDDVFVFTTMVGTPLDPERFVEKHWHRALRATGRHKCAETVCAGGVTCPLRADTATSPELP